MRLRTAVFSALAAVIRADGVVTPDEREALMEAAKAAGVNETEVARVIDGAVPSASEWMASVALTFEERVLVYAAAVWLAGVDGNVADEETAAVEKLGDALGLTENDRTIAALAAGGFSASAERGVLGLAHAITEHQNLNET